MAFSLVPHSFFALPQGGTLRYAQFPAVGPEKGCILVLPGRREFIEKKYSELSSLTEQGYRLIIVESRGQGLATRFLTGDKRQRDHITDFKTLLDDLRAFYASIVQPSLLSPLILHGHSMGGHLAVRWLAEDALPVAGAFLTAPMLALSGTPAHMAAYGLSWTNVRLFGHDDRYAPTQHDFGGDDVIFDKNPLTQDEDRFRIIENYFRVFPDLTVGGVTWGWLLAALKSMQAVHAWQYLSRIGVPVLALAGEHDRVTPAKDILPYLNMIPRVRTHVVPNARHDILNEADTARLDAWSQIKAFLTLMTEA